MNSGGSFVGSLAVHLNRKHREEQEKFASNKLFNLEGGIEEHPTSFNGLQVAGVSVQISTIPKQFWGEIEDLPPLMYVEMSKDKRTSNAVDESIRRMQRSQKLNDRIIVEKRSAQPRALVPDYFSNREGTGPAGECLSLGFG